jgi:hypothetical protein
MMSRTDLVLLQMSREIGVYLPMDPRQKQYGIPGGGGLLNSPTGPPSFYVNH